MTTTQHHLTTHPPGECAVCRRCSPPLTVARLDLLKRVSALNHVDVMPAKAALTRGLPARTASNQHLMIGEMIHAGLLTNVAPAGAGAYELQTTEDGEHVLAGDS